MKATTQVAPVAVRKADILIPRDDGASSFPSSRPP